MTASDDGPLGHLCLRNGLGVLDPSSVRWHWLGLGNNHFTCQVFSLNPLGAGLSGHCIRALYILPEALLWERSHFPQHGWAGGEGGPLTSLQHPRIFFKLPHSPSMYWGPPPHTSWGHSEKPRPKVRLAHPPCKEQTSSPRTAPDSIRWGLVSPTCPRSQPGIPSRSTWCLARKIVIGVFVDVHLFLPPALSSFYQQFSNCGSQDPLTA